MLIMFASIIKYLCVGPGRTVGWGGGWQAEATAGESDSWGQNEEIWRGHFATGRPELQVPQGEREKTEKVFIQAKGFG